MVKQSCKACISRALVEFNEEFKSTLKAEGLMTRDPRMVERKKFGQKKLERNSNSQKDKIWQILKLKNYWMLVFILVT